MGSFVHRKVYTHAPCLDCGKTPKARGTDSFYRGRCLPCRHPATVRKLIEAGLPCGTAMVLANLLRKCQIGKTSNRHTERMLSFVHPIVMMNIKVENGILTLVDKRCRWIRRHGWWTDL